MTNSWIETLESIQIILFDYSALFEVCHSNAFKKLSEAIISRRIHVVISSSFNYYHSCVLRGMNANEKAKTEQIESFMDLLSHEKLLETDMTVMSMFSLLPKYCERKDACLCTSVHSSLINQIKAVNLKGSLSICVFDNDSHEIYPDLFSFLGSKPPYTVNPVASSSDYLDVAIYVNVGDKVYIDNGESVLLSEKISTGSEGLVFRTQNPNMVAKIYHRGVMTALRWMKLTRMTKMGLQVKGICWPTSLLYNQRHEPVGYLMSTAQGYTLGSVFDGQDAILDRFPDWDRSSVVQAACQIFEKIIYLHLHGILIGDIQLKNIMIKNPSEVYLIDIDSVQLEDLPCPVGTEEFTPPELWDRSFSTFLRDSVHEDYSCGILAFSLLFCGQHPYNQRNGHETLREEIAGLAFPYAYGNGDSSRAPVGGYDKIWIATPLELQQMFCSAFLEGKRFETIDWYVALNAYMEQLNSNTFADPESYRLFPYIKKPVQILSDNRSYNKRSIRDSIIHVPESNERDKISSNRVMYNGRVTGIAFVNQDKLTEMELDTYRKQASINPPEEQPAKSNLETKASDQVIPDRSNYSGLKKDPINGAAGHKSGEKKTVNKKKNTRVILMLLLGSVLIVAIIYYIIAYK